MKRPSPALVVAIIALVAACTGTGFAANELITRSTQIRNGAITGADIKDGSLAAKEISSAGRRSIRGSGSGGSSPLKGDKGLKGDPGIKGDKGDRGDAGPPGADALATTARTVYRSQFTVPKQAEGTNIILLTMSSLPAGSYHFTAVQHLKSKGPKNTEFTCAMVSSTAGRTESAAITLGAEPGGVTQGTLTEQVTLTAAEPITMRLVCTPETGATLEADGVSASIVAVRLQSETAASVTG